MRIITQHNLCKYFIVYNSSTSKGSKCTMTENINGSLFKQMSRNMDLGEWIIDYNALLSIQKCEHTNDDLPPQTFKINESV